MTSCHTLPFFARQGHTGASELTTDRETAVASRGKARIACDVPGDQECAWHRTIEATLHRLGPFGHAECDRCLAIDPRDRRPGDKPCLARVVRTDFHSVELEALHQIVTLQNGHRDVDGAGVTARDLKIVLQSARKRMIDLRRA